MLFSGCNTKKISSSGESLTVTKANWQTLWYMYPLVHFRFFGDERFFEAGRLLTFPTDAVGAYLRISAKSYKYGT